MNRGPVGHVATDPDAAHTSDRILDVALDRFSRLGYEGTSMREIARSVGIQAAGLYNHYESKEQILWRIVEEAMTALERAQEGSSTSKLGIDDRLRKFIRTHVRWHALNARHGRVANVQVYSLSAEHFRLAADFRRGYERHMEEMIAKGNELGEFAAPNPRVAAFAILQMGTGVANWYRPDGQINVDELCDQYETMSLRLVGAHSEWPDF